MDEGTGRTVSSGETLRVAGGGSFGCAAVVLLAVVVVTSWLLGGTLWRLVADLGLPPRGLAVLAVVSVLGCLLGLPVASDLVGSGRPLLTACLVGLALVCGSFSFGLLVGRGTGAEGRLVEQVTDEVGRVDLATALVEGTTAGFFGLLLAAVVFVAVGIPGDAGRLRWTTACVAGPVSGLALVVVLLLRVPGT